MIACSRNLALVFWKDPLGGISTISQLVTSFQISRRTTTSCSIFSSLRSLLSLRGGSRGASFLFTFHFSLSRGNRVQSFTPSLTNFTGIERTVMLRKNLTGETAAFLLVLPPHPPPPLLSCTMNHNWQRKWYNTKKRSASHSLSLLSLTVRHPSLPFM